MGRVWRFDGWIAGVGTAAGVRVVVGCWAGSPFGSFADVMVQDAAGHRVLVAPAGPAEFVAATYRFDEVCVAPVRVERAADGWAVQAGPLTARLAVGGRTALGLLLRTVPPALATRRWWVSALDPVARSALPGVRTRGSAAGGRREWYAALDLHRVAAASVHWRGADCGGLQALRPPVTFGFGSTPATPAVVRVVSWVSGG